MIAKVKTRPVRVQRNGKIHYLGRAPEAAARSIEDAVRGEYARTGRVAGSRTVRQAPGCLTYRDDPLLWEAGQDAELSDEMKLMLAVFRDAVDCLRSNDPRVRLEAQRWFATDDRGHVFAFASICDQVDLDPAIVRRRLLRG